MNEPPDGSAERNQEFEKLLEQFSSAVNSKQNEAAEDLAFAMLQFAAGEAVAEPSPEDLIRERVDACEESGDWAGAETARKEILALALEKPNAGFATKAHWELARHYSIRGLLVEALAHSTAALEAARQSDISTLVYMALDRQAQTHLLKGNLNEAAAAIDECLSLMPIEPITSGPRANALTIRADCMAQLRRFDEAEANLRKAGEILAPGQPSVFLGAKNGMAAWWRASWLLCAIRENWIGALKAAQEETALRRECVTALSDIGRMQALAESLARMEKSCQGCGLAREAREAGQESDKIRSRLNLPPLAR